MENITTKLTSMNLHESLVLTRLLYAKDEVKQMCLCALLKNDKYEALFWFNELYQSGFKKESFALLYSINMIWYAAKNPKLEKYIINKYNKWKETDNYMTLVEIIINIVNKKYTADVKQMYDRMTNGMGNEHKYRGRNPAFLKPYPKKYHSLLQSINKNDLENIACAMGGLTANSELFEVITSYFENVEKVPLKKGCTEVFDEFLRNELDNDVTKYLLCIIIHCKTMEHDINISNVYITPSDDIRQYIEELNDYSGIQSYDILKVKRLYGVDPAIMSDKELARHHLDTSMHTALVWHWSYYASRTPYWEEKFNEIEGAWARDDNKKQIRFHSETGEEECEERYGMEFDEQDVQTKQKGYV